MEENIYCLKFDKEKLSEFYKSTSPLLDENRKKSQEL